MNLQEKIELEMRLGAIEYMLCKLNLAMLAAVAPFDEINQKLDEFVEGAATQQFDDPDPIQSDLAAAAWQIAIERLVSAQRYMLAQIVAGEGRVAASRR